MGDNERLCAAEHRLLLERFSTPGGARTRECWVGRPALDILSYRGSRRSKIIQGSYQETEQAVKKAKEDMIGTQCEEIETCLNKINSK